MKSWLLIGSKIVAALWIFVASIAAISLWRTNADSSIVGFFWEFCKVVLGPFVGAGLAFIVNDYVHKERKTEEEKSAARTAAFSIRAMYDDFTNYRYVIRYETASLHQKHSRWPDGPAPIWAYAKPLIFTFSSNSLPDLKTLQFLLAHPEGQVAFTKMQVLERAYKDLANAHTFYIETSEALQNKIENIEPGASWQVDADAIGPRLTAKARDALLAILIRINDEQLYLDTRDSLAQAATAYFKGKLTIGEIAVHNEKLKTENLPSLPEHIAQCLKNEQ
ncbi:hypothetical protein [Herbaspirillum sp. RV1423]|uniref:hypothetical protein n=1 Tax=Herbaspirillum sp. RV1423 TaxID=1443993 RepID=UPI00054D97BF|nr:hypothetical protein [Herbaspirillum sp. RV1423]